MLDNLNSNFESSKAQRPDANDDEVEIDLLEIFYALKKIFREFCRMVVQSRGEPVRQCLQQRRSSRLLLL